MYPQIYNVEKIYHVHNEALKTTLDELKTIFRALAIRFSGKIKQFSDIFFIFPEYHRQ